jgi:hypothetical protein
VIELRAVEAFVFRLLLLLALRKQMLCAFLSLIFLCGIMPFFVVGVLPMLEIVAGSSENGNKHSVSISNGELETGE